MNYCATCGKSGATKKTGKLSYHFRCAPQQPDYRIDPDFLVKPMKENRIQSTMKTLSVHLEAINHPHPHIILIKS